MYKKMNKSRFHSKKITTFLAIIVIILGSISLYIINIESNKYPSRKPFNFEIESNSIKITGWGNADINFPDIKSISLINAPLSVNFNLGGGNINNIIFGKEYIENFGSSICFVEDLNKPSIYIKTISKNYFINFSSPEKTINYFNILKEKL